MQLGRHAEAEAELRAALAEEPHHPDALALMSLCRQNAKQYDEGVHWAEQAVAQGPYSFSYLVLAQAYFYRNDLAKARLAIAEGQRLDPRDPAFFHLLGNIEFNQGYWWEVLANTEEGLGLDPQHLPMINLRARALLQLNRPKEASVLIDHALSLSPNDPTAHASLGWVALQNDQYEPAVQHFLEALRLDPKSEYAHEGLKEAIRWKNPISRAVFQYFRWMADLSEKNRMIFGAFIYIVCRIAMAVAEVEDFMASLLYSLLALYAFFFLSVAIARPFSNLFLRLHPLGKHALTADEKLGTNLLGLFVFSGALFLAAWLQTDLPLFPKLATLSFAAAVFLGGAFSVPPTHPARRNLLYYSAAMLAFGLAWAVGGLLWALPIFLTGGVLYSFVIYYFVSKVSNVD